MAESYSCSKVAYVLKTLRDFGNDTKGDVIHVVLFRSDAKTFPCPTILARKDIYGLVSVEDASDAKYPEVKMEIKRYVLALEWLVGRIGGASDHGQSSGGSGTAAVPIDPCATQVLITDFNDIIFQSNPFAWLSSTGTDVVIGDENYPTWQRDLPRLTICNENTYSTKRWLTSCAEQIFGPNITANEIMPRLCDMPILNSGIILGKAQAMVQMLRVMATVADLLDTTAALSSGQGILNLCYYLGLFSAAHVNVQVIPSLISNFVHCGSYLPDIKHPEQPFHPANNPFVNIFGEPYAILHMVDRGHMVDRINKPWRDQYMSNITVF